MVSNIFSSFDPAIFSLYPAFNTTLFWASSVIYTMVMATSFWMAHSRLSFLTKSPTVFMHDQVSRTLGSNINGFSPALSTLFLMILMINLAGLIPYMFSLSSHLIFTLSFALPLWLMLILSSLLFAPYTFFASLLPSGAPDWLNPFLVLIETTSNIVRPITLSFRLAANMTAGHIVLTLIGVYGSASMFSSIFSFIFLLSLQSFYILFELAICLIQAFIFCLLLSLYSEDHPHTKEFL
uniref:ATP synthase subunit a n=1 Tax=Paralvinella hessleri TaxID=36111 RepID=A0A6H0EM20_9ANNE|nr:ATP synthase Fo subunit 6 [Paralvinella hessleri]